MPNKYFQIDGVATFVHHTGRTTLPEQPPVALPGPPLLCLHGEGGNGHVFHGLFERLGDAHTLIAFDQPGHGRSGELDSLGSIDRMAAFTLAFADKLGLQAPILLGHSMGAAVALRCALEQPDAVSGLVLASGGTRFDLSSEALTQARRVSEGKARRAFDPSLFSSSAPPEVMRGAFMEGMKTDPRATYGDLLACDEWDDACRLGDVACPTLVLVGEDDREGARGAANELAGALSDARLEAIPAAGHWLTLEAPEAMADAIRAFAGGLS